MLETPGFSNSVLNFARQMDERIENLAKTDAEKKHSNNVLREPQQEEQPKEGQTGYNFCMRYIYLIQCMLLGLYIRSKNEVGTTEL